MKMVCELCTDPPEFTWPEFLSNVQTLRLAVRECKDIREAFDKNACHIFKERLERFGFGHDVDAQLVELVMAEAEKAHLKFHKNPEVWPVHVFRQGHEKFARELGMRTCCYDVEVQLLAPIPINGRNVYLACCELGGKPFFRTVLTKDMVRRDQRRILKDLETAYLNYPADDSLKREEMIYAIQILKGSEV